MTSRLGSPGFLAARFASGLAIGARLAALVPIPIGIAMFAFAPNYTTELVGSPIGWLLLLLAIAFTAGGYAANELAIRLSRKGNLPIGTALIAASTVFLTFPALWLVLIGPAVVIYI
jgi:hypothetical protein